jgi:hypothetical protein
MGKRGMSKADIKHLLWFHTEINKREVGSDERTAWLEEAHDVFMQAMSRGRGRPKRRTKIDEDWVALAGMYAREATTGETCMTKLANDAIDAKLVRKVHDRASVLDRLVRKYGAWRKRGVNTPF